MIIPRSLIPGRASLMVWNDADRLTASTSSHFSFGNVSIELTCCIPAHVCVCVCVCVILHYVHVYLHYLLRYLDYVNIFVE